jgi:glycerol-3-phosphate O-acyltransferase/dihydroxyacetone phosphate acyltransferase
MARDLMWEDPKSINLDEFVTVSQTYVPISQSCLFLIYLFSSRLVDLFSTPDITSNFSAVKRHLLEYYSLLQTIGLTNSVLSNLPLPRSLDPNHPSRLPSRLYTLFILIRDTLYALFRLPFFFLPLLFHFPIYIMARLGARLAEDEEESQAQNKVAFGLLLCLMMYPTAFFILWAFFWFTPAGALGSAIMVWLFAIYHNKLINGAFYFPRRLFRLTLVFNRKLREVRVYSCVLLFPPP